MKRKPGGDNLVGHSQAGTEWATILGHRSPDDNAFAEVVARFVDCGISPLQVQQALADGGDAIFAAATSGDPEWAKPFGGPLGVALIAAEISACAAQVNSRASGVRSVAVEQLLDDFSAVTVARELGVSRQKVYEIARTGLRPPYLNTVPWRQS